MRSLAQSRRTRTPPPRKNVVAIVGSRTFTDYEEFGVRLYEALHGWGLNITDVSFVSGGAEGADSLAETFAQSIGATIKVCPADWTKYGKQAGPIRNKLIVKCATHVLAFPSRTRSPGTLNTIRLAREAKHISSDEIVVVWVE